MSELHQAAAAGDAEAVEDILRHGRCDPNQRDIDWSHKTALHWAAAGGHTECVQLLLTHGSRAGLQTDLGWTAAHFAAEAGRLGVLRLLHVHHAPLDQPDRSGDTPTRIAQIYGHEDCALFLQKAEVEVQAHREKGLVLDEVDEQWTQNSKENTENNDKNT